MNQINIRLRKNCVGEWCWIQQNYVKSLNDDEINNTLDLPHPENGMIVKMNGYLQLILKM